MNKLKIFFITFFSLDALAVLVFLTMLFLSWSKIIILGNIHLILFIILDVANLGVLIYTTIVLVLNKRIKRQKSE